MGNLEWPVDLTPSFTCFWTVGGSHSTQREPTQAQENMQTPHRNTLIWNQTHALLRGDSTAPLHHCEFHKLIPHPSHVIFVPKKKFQSGETHFERVFTFHRIEDPPESRHWWWWWGQAGSHKNRVGRELCARPASELRKLEDDGVEEEVHTNILQWHLTDTHENWFKDLLQWHYRLIAIIACSGWMKRIRPQQAN